MKKILFHLYNLERGGAERVVSTLAERFAKEGYSVLIATEEFGKDEYPLASAVERIHAGLSEKQEKSNSLFRYINRILNLRKVIINHKPDIVVAFARKNNYRALMASLGIKMPVVISVRVDPKVTYSSWKDRLQMKLLTGKIAGCVFQTEEQQVFFSEKIQKKSRVIVNPINPKFTGRQLPDNRENVVVHSGRLVGFKNQLMLMEAFIKVHEKHPGFCLKLFGGDSFDGTREKLEEYIDSNNAGDFIHIMGQSPNIEDELMKGKLAAFSSDYEGMPNAMLEALALGLPVVATDCPPGASRMVIEDRVNGLLVPVKDADAMAEAISYMIENPQIADEMGRKAAKRTEEICGLEVVFRQWEDYIKSLCNS